MVIKLTYKIKNAGAVFNCKDRNEEKINFNEWGLQKIITQTGSSARIGILNLLIEDEKAIISDDELSVTIPHDEIAKLEQWQTIGLGLPEIAPFRLVIDTKNTLASNDFSIEYGFSYPDSMPATGAQRSGSIIDHNKKKFILPDPLYSIANLIDHYQQQPIQDMDERFLWWAKIREILPDEVEMGSFLRRINVVKPETFTIDIKETTGDIQVTPRFVISPQKNRSEENIEDSKEPENLIPQKVQDEFSNLFHRYQDTKSRYSLNNKWFIVIPKSLKIALQTVRKVNSASIEKKRAFIHNPRAEIKKELEKLIDDEAIESIFVETPLFLGDRIKCLGIWQPKAGIYIKTEKSEWLPSEAIPSVIGIPINGSIHNIRTKDLPELEKKIEEALENDIEEIEFKGHKLRIDDQLLKTVKRASQIFIPQKPPDNLKKEREKENTDRDTEVPIIYDHIEELGISTGPNKIRTCIDESPPELSRGIQLQAHQKKGFSWLQRHWRIASTGALLADDMGLGKTLQALTFIKWVTRQMKAGCTNFRPHLIVAPTGLLKNWEAEAGKFLPQYSLGSLFKAHGAQFRMCYEKGWTTAAHELKEAGWVLTTYETLRDKINAFIKVYWAVVVFDEVQKIKNPKSMVTDMAKSLKAEFTLAMTGTPVENSLVDLWCISDAVQPGCLGTLKDFAAKYIPNGKSGEYNLSQLKNRLERPKSSPLILRRTKDIHWTERPEKKEKLYPNEMPLEQARAYTSAIERAKNQRERKRGTMLKVIQELRSISLHPMMQKDVWEQHEKFIEASARLRATFKILDEIAQHEEKVLIFVEYLKMQSALSEIIEQRYNCDKVMIINGHVSGVKRQARVDKFQRSLKGFDAMILSPRAGGLGLNLTAATNVIHLSRWWNPAIEDQCSDRAYRIGQKRSVTIHYPMAIHPAYGNKHSFDIKLHELLEKKRNLSQRLLAPPAGTGDDVKWLFEHSIIRGENSSNGERSSQKKMAEINLDRIDLMEPIEFENWVLNQMVKKGFDIKKTPVTGDKGADGIAIPREPNKPAILIQCKHTQGGRRIGIAAVDEIITAQQSYSDQYPGADLMVVTNAKGFENSAKNKAKKNNVRLISRNCLKNL